MTRTATELWVADLGHVPYPDAVAFQERLRAARQDGGCPTAAAARAPARLHARAPHRPADLPMGEDWYRARASRSTLRSRRAA